MASALYSKLRRTSRDIAALRRLAPKQPRAERIRYSNRISAFWQMWRAIVEDSVGIRLDAKRPTKNAFAELLKTSRLNVFLKNLGQDLSSRGKKYTSKITRLPVRIPNEDFVIGDFVDENLKLITSLGNEQVGIISTILELALQSGQRSEDTAKELNHILDVGESHAQLIARDQTLKGAATFNRLAQQAVGVESYTWLTSKDERVRESHADLDGQTFQYSDPPDTGNGRNHPGEDIQCRCVAVPIIPLFEGI